MRGSGQRLPITLRFTRVLGTFSHTTCFPFSCALWACFSDRSVSGERSEPIGALMPHAALWVVQQTQVQETRQQDEVSMPHAALWVVQRCSRMSLRKFRTSFNAARGFVGGATFLYSIHFSFFGVSMPHAALWVVQPRMEREGLDAGEWFQCRTRLCGWCNCIARSPCPPRGKKPFWKVSENLSVLTENM